MEYLDLIIAEINNKEKQEERPVLQLPLPEPKYCDNTEKDDEVEPKRVIIIEL